MLHDAARLAVKRGAVATVAHRLVIHALPRGEPPALRGGLQGLRLGVGQQRGVWFWVMMVLVLVMGKRRVWGDGEFGLQEVGAGVQCDRGLQLH